MPPHGLEYTNSSSLTASRPENTSWSNNGSEDDESAWKHEERPARAMDRHYQERANRRKAAYHSLMSGEYGEPVSNLGTSEGDVIVEGDEPSSAEAQEARQKRLGRRGEDTLEMDDESLDQSVKIRVLRAQRLRQPLEPSKNEEETMERIRARRQRDLKLERKERMAEEARKAEAARNAVVEDLRIEEEKLKNKETFQVSEIWFPSSSSENSVKDKRSTRSATRSATSSATRSASSKQKSVGGVDDCGFLGDNVLDVIQDALRDTGVLSMCAATCFGEDARRSRSRSGRKIPTRE